MIAIRLALGCLALAVPTVAQEPGTLQPARLLAEGAWNELPLVRTCPGERTPEFQAARNGYKVALDEEGFVFTPFLGPEYPGEASLRWRSLGFRRGKGSKMTPEDARLITTTWSAALESSSVTEHWDLLEEGLEQSWSFEALPAGEGPLLIEGEIETVLRHEPREAEHADLVFHDADGKAVLRYGKAWAFDARGRTLNVPTSFDGSIVRLIVDEAWLESAAFPIRVDPLVAPIPFGFPTQARPLGSVAVASQRETSTAELLVVFTRVFSVNDHDVYALVCDHDFQNARLVYSDLATTFSDSHVGAGYLPGADRWILCHQSDHVTASGNASSVRVVFHDLSSTTNNSGLVRTVSAGSTSYAEPVLGGGGDWGTQATGLVVFRRDFGTTRVNTNHSEVQCAWIDGANRTLTVPTNVSATPVGVSLDREAPAVTSVGGVSSYGWLVAWQEIDRQVSGDDWDIRGARFGSSQNRIGEAQLADGGGSRHALSPRVAGSRNGFLLTFGLTSWVWSSHIDEIRSRRIEWGTTTAALPAFPTPVRRVHGPLGSSPGFEIGDLSADEFSHSHYVLSFSRPVSDPALGTRKVGHVLRLGGTGAPTESETFLDLVAQDVLPPAIAFSTRGSDHFVVTGSATLAGDLRGGKVTYPSGLAPTNIGGGCGVAQLTTTVALAGNRSFGVFTNNMQPGNAGVVLMSLASSHLPLDGIGMPGCTARIDLGTSFVTTFPFTAGGTGVGVAPMPLPDFPVFRGEFYVQGAYLERVGGTTQVKITDALFVRVR